MARRTAAQQRPLDASTALLARLKALAPGGGLLPFDRFMETVLYDPQHGFFSTRADRAARSGDFLTAPEVTPLFAGVVHDWIARQWRASGSRRYAYVEVGAGRGTLAAGIQAAAGRQGHAERLELHLVERGTRARQALEAAVPGAHVYGDVGELPTALGAGAFVANELFDNLPVRRVMQADSLQEICVRIQGRRIREALRSAPAELDELVRQQGLRLSAGQSAEVCAGAVPLLEAVLGRLDPGALLVVDYGGEAVDVSGDSAPNGTLAAHKGHARHTDLYADLGQQDLTAHVNFSPLRTAAQRLGYDVELTTQGRFLVREGLPERLQALVADAGDDFERLRLAQLAKQLYHPEAMGDAFKVLAGTRNRGVARTHTIT